MGSMRPSIRSKASGPVGQHLANGGIAREELSVFESESFDADSYVQGKCQSMSEKGIRKLCSELTELKRDSAEEMRKSVYANYSAFIQTSREISDLECELVSMRNLLTTQAALVHKLAEVQLPPMISENGGSLPHENGHVDDDSTSASETEARALLDVTDIYIAERKIEKALDALQRCEALLRPLKSSNSLEQLFMDQRLRLTELLTQFAKQPSIRSAELRSVISALDRLGDGPHAHTLLLYSHHDRLQRAIANLRPSGTSYGGAYTAGLCQLVFSHIAQAARSSTAVFGEQPSYASELVLWARGETENFVALIKKHVLSASAASGGLRAAAECVQIALGHCTLLEGYGLALSPVLTMMVKPSVEQALDANLRRIEDSVSVLAAADDWTLVQPPPRTGLRAASSILFPPHLKLSTSAYRFISMVQDFVDDVTPLTSMHLTSTTLDGVARLFDSFVHLLMRAMPAAIDDEDVPEITDNLSIKVADTDAEKLSLLANAAAMADELLPRTIVKILPLKDREESRMRRSLDKPATGVRSEHREFRRRTQRAVDKLRDRFCQKYALELIYTDEGESLLSADLYLGLDNDGDTANSAWLDDPMPSPVFQTLFERIKTIAAAGGDVMSGRERFVTVLLIRLVETVVLYLSSDQDFWEDIEDGPRPLGPVGLQQMVLDMKFAVQMAGQVNHSSLRHLRQLVEDLIARAIDAYAATGMDPYSVLPEETWFMGMAQEAIDRLSGGWSKDSASPTASVSANSISSLKSHGSP
ncbi:hypothetical protein SELMODRAFT_441646 [Selaginella moellendorffii]|uniref:Exocyst component Exo84 C-terminal domain-containing protein n=1 Tax=Selaginella moellendorffii TaxID=88036 RepID=D8RLL6_SELML|nr:exocyst complex component EXO84B [Selaginella moellendorffii]EFJ26745.1 hypothetical protein SELMODRAFT_441646 [Selaginella moellendorffii]|eukprot:XP_002971828.1 exocyst complex component EXO84B [Selaginella moellendorffii]